MWLAAHAMRCSENGLWEGASLRSESDMYGVSAAEAGDWLMSVRENPIGLGVLTEPALEIQAVMRQLGHTCC